ncbi:MAG: hypothetical protein S4CHLAM7_00230 [Chlamydiae bacterium]|nr:hypothetical protein [Chlamydiota bacterium]
MSLKRLFILNCIASQILLFSQGENLQGLYNGLNPSSITEHLALHKLYPNDSVGQQALRDIQLLLAKSNADPDALAQLPTSTLSLEGFLSFMHGNNFKTGLLDDEQLSAIERTSQHLPNRNLKGHLVKTEKEVLALAPDDIDLARALLIAQQSDSEIDWTWIRNYEAQLDFMALQVLARLPEKPTAKQIIKELNQLIFFEMRYRYPSLSSLKTGEEPFSKLTTVLDSKKGVCLGVSVLYLCLSQRLSLPLEILIPPGHIFVRYNDEGRDINIETTARGIDYPSENYLDVNTTSIKKANLKEVIGFVFYNVSSSYLINTQDYPKAIQNYLNCLKYAPEDPATLELLGYAYILNSQDKEAKKVFKKLMQTSSEHQIASVYLDTADAYLKNKIGSDAIAAIIHQDEDQTLTSIKQKQEMLKKIVEKYPHFKAGHFFLAQTYQELSQTKEAIRSLEKVHVENASYPYVEFSLANLYMSEYNFPKAWEHFKVLEQLLDEHKHQPKIAKELKKALKQFSIEP